MTVLPFDRLYLLNEVYVAIVLVSLEILDKSAWHDTSLDFGSGATGTCSSLTLKAVPSTVALFWVGSECASN